MTRCDRRRPQNLIRMRNPAVLFWRLVYGSLRLPWLRRYLVKRYRHLQATRGSGPARKFLRRTVFALSLSRFRQYEGYVPLQAWETFWQVARGVDSQGQTPRRLPQPGAKLRVGLLGMIAAPPYFPQKLFRNLPQEMELHFFETDSKITAQSHLNHTEAKSFTHDMIHWRDDLPSSGISSQPAYAAQVENMARQINEKSLDLLLTSAPGRELFDILDRVDVPAIADLTVSSSACFHPKNDIQFYIHAIKDYVVRDHRLLCRSSERYFERPPFAVPYCLIFDTNGYEGEPIPWAERRHHLFFHGRLVKAAQPAFLQMLIRLLQEDPELHFVFYGIDARGALDAILSAARRAGLASRVDYRGRFSLERNAEGRIVDPNWSRCLDDLRHAKLAPTSFPMASGCARFESYTAGVPCVNLALCADNRRWTASTETLVDIPALYTPSATVQNLAEYQKTALRLLHEPALAAQVIAEQQEVVQRLGSPTTFWRQILDACQLWLKQRN
jgi:hypothetical protein